jgi:hypothetical protein
LAALRESSAHIAIYHFHKQLQGNHLSQIKKPGMKIPKAIPTRKTWRRPWASAWLRKRESRCAWLLGFASRHVSFRRLAFR